VPYVGAQLVRRPLAGCDTVRVRGTGGGSRARRTRPADAVRPDGCPVRRVVRCPPGRGTGFARAERGGQDHDDRNTRGLQDAVVRAGQCARHRSGARRGGVAGPDRGGPAVLAGPWQMAGQGAARAPGFVLRAVRGTWRAAAVGRGRAHRHGRAHRAGRPAGSPPVRRAATPPGRGHRHRGPARAAVPRRADGRVRPRGQARIPRPGAPAGRPRGGHHPAHHARPRRSREAGRPDPDPGGRQDHRGRVGGRAVPADVHPGRGAVEPRRAAVRARGGRADAVRPRAVPAVRRVRRGSGGAAGQPGGHLRGAGPAGRIGGLRFRPGRRACGAAGSN
jgi:hypothetical protein